MLEGPTLEGVFSTLHRYKYSMLKFQAFLREFRVVGKPASEGIERYALSPKKGFIWKVPHGQKQLRIRLEPTERFENLLVKMVENLKTDFNWEKFSDYEKREYANNPWWPLKIKEATDSYGMTNKIDYLLRLRGDEVRDWVKFTFPDPISRDVQVDIIDHMTNDKEAQRSIIYALLPSPFYMTASYKQSPENFPLSVEGLRKYHAYRPPWTSLGMYSFLVVDHDKKIIYPQDETVEDSNRMGTKEPNSKATYTLIKSDFSIDEPAIARKMVASLVRADSKLLQYEYVDNYHNDQHIPVEVFIQRKSDTHIGKAIQSADIVRGARDGQIIAYHGTSLAAWKEIQKAGFMSPGKGPHYSDKIQGHSEHNLYFSTDIHKVRKYGTREAKAGQAVILQVLIPDNTKIVFDEDALSVGVRKTIRRVGVDRVNRMFSDQEVPLQEIDRVVYAHIAGRQHFKPFTMTKEIESFINLCKIEATKIVSHSGQAFAYRGKIPLKNIRVAENFKSSRYYENPEKDAIGYERHAASRKFNG